MHGCDPIRTHFFSFFSRQVGIGKDTAKHSCVPVTFCDWLGEHESNPDTDPHHDAQPRHPSPRTEVMPTDPILTEPPVGPTWNLQPASGPALRIKSHGSSGRAGPRLPAASCKVLLALGSVVSEPRGLFSSAMRLYIVLICRRHSSDTQQGFRAGGERPRRGRE